MTPKDICNIENTLGIRLPESYKAIVLNHPYPDQKYICEALIHDPKLVIEQNIVHRNDGWFSLDWPDHYFVIGDDGCGDTYFMVIGKNEKVYFADHEAGAHPIYELEECFHSESVRGHVEHEMEIQRELDEEEQIAKEQRKNKKWWQFWI